MVPEVREAPGLPPKVMSRVAVHWLLQWHCPGLAAALLGFCFADNAQELLNTLTATAWCCFLVPWLWLYQITLDILLQVCFAQGAAGVVVFWEGRTFWHDTLQPFLTFHQSKPLS